MDEVFILADPDCPRCKEEPAQLFADEVKSCVRTSRKSAAGLDVGRPFLMEGTRWGNGSQRKWHGLGH